MAFLLPVQGQRQEVDEQHVPDGLWEKREAAQATGTLGTRGSHEAAIPIIVKTFLRMLTRCLERPRPRSVDERATTVQGRSSHGQARSGRFHVQCGPGRALYRFGKGSWIGAISFGVRPLRLAWRPWSWRRSIWQQGFYCFLKLVTHERLGKEIGS
jgi:hypothetical protein